MILDAIATTDGAFTTVNNTDIKIGLEILSAKGIYVEPTSAVVVKGYQKVSGNRYYKHRRSGSVNSHRYRFKSEQCSIRTEL